jgi:amino acid transporter
VKTKRIIYSRRLRFTLVVLASQLLLIVLALAWGIQLVAIALRGGVLSIETNPWILYGEIVATIFIIVFAIFVLVFEFKRLTARRQSDTENRDEREHSEVDGEPIDVSRAEYIEDLLK